MRNKVLPQMNTVNAMCRIAERAIKEKFETAYNDEVIALLREAVIIEDSGAKILLSRLHYYGNMYIECSRDGDLINILRLYMIHCDTFPLRGQSPT